MGEKRKWCSLAEKSDASKKVPTLLEGHVGYATASGCPHDEERFFHVDDLRSPCFGENHKCCHGLGETEWIVEQTSDKELLRAFLAVCPQVHTYALGDLSEPHWAHCRWHLLRRKQRQNGQDIQAQERQDVQAVALLYTALQTPVLQVLADPENPLALAAAASLLHVLASRDLLPTGAFACHTNVGFDILLTQAGFDVKGHAHVRMALRPDCHLKELPIYNYGDIAGAVLLSAEDAEAAAALCATMPRSWFESHVLDEGRYLGIWSEDAEHGKQTLVSIGGTHVFSPLDKVAALGNVCTHPDFQGRGFARSLVYQLCCRLHSEGVTTIALNVEQGNQAALRLYSSLGFETVMSFIECEVRRA